MLQEFLKEGRARAGMSLAACGAVLGISAEGYRQKEARANLTGAELALLAAAWGLPLSAFPYTPTAGEVALARELAPQLEPAGS